MAHDRSVSQPPSRTALVAIALAATVAAYFLPHVVSVLLLLFAGIVLAVLLDAITATVQRVLPGGRLVGLAGMSIVVVLVLAAAGLLVIPQLMDQAPALARRLPEAWSQFRSRLEEYPPLRPLLAQAADPSQWLRGGGLLGRVTGVVSGTFDALLNLFIIAFIGVYLVADPERHRNVLLYPLARQNQGRARQLLVELGRELRYWLAGRAISMTIVGVTTGIALWVLGVRLAFTLGLLAGVLSFVPYLGPVLAMVPALLIALADSAVLAGTVLAVYVGIQLLESYLVTPLVQQRASAIPPALLIAVQLLGGVFGGVLGILLAAPLALAAATAVRRIYIEPIQTQSAGPA